ncbi:MAG: selenide, water dikinase SelD [Sphaerochaetaceae bacterium]
MDEKCSVKLTSMVKTSGCAAKLPPARLEKILSKLPIVSNDHLIKGFAGNEDALVYDLDDGRCLIETVDFFPPMVDNPRVFGHIAAANALSDSYAMGCNPVLALNIVCMPSCLDDSVMEEILLGGQEKASECGVVIGGGHTISDPTPKYGLCVTGIGRIEQIWKNQGAKVGDVLVLSKKLGTGIIMTASKAEMAEDKSVEEAIKSMETLNKNAFEAAEGLKVHSATDVTGFSLLGHSYEMTGKGDISIVIESEKVPLMYGVRELALFGLIPEGMYHNRDYLKGRISFANKIDQDLIDVLYDPQTSGGLLLALSKEDATRYIDKLNGEAWIVGHVEEKQETQIIVW